MKTAAKIVIITSLIMTTIVFTIDYIFLDQVMTDYEILRSIAFNIMGTWLGTIVGRRRNRGRK